MTNKEKRDLLYHARGLISKGMAEGAYDSIVAPNLPATVREGLKELLKDYKKPSQKGATLPQVLEFTGLSPAHTLRPQTCFYEVIGEREPREGEYYVSGAIPQAYRAPSDLEGMAYMIVRPTHKARLTQFYERCEAIS